MAKQLAFDREAREAIQRGVTKIARAVKATLGPRGRNAVLDKGWGSPNITKDGVTVAEEVELSDPYENLGAQLVKEAASKTSDVVGDGTTTATVLSEAIFNEGLKCVTAGHNPMMLIRGINLALDKIIAHLHSMSKPVQGKKDIAYVGKIASNNDDTIGKMISEAMAKVGKDGVITVEESKGIETDVEVVEGMQFDRGYLSPHFVTDQDRMEVVLDKPYVLLHEEKITSVKKIVPLLERITKEGASLLIIAEDIEGDALATLVVNKLRGTLKVAAVKAPGYGERRKAMLQDLATLTGGKVLFKDLGIDLESLDPTYFGRAKKITINNENTVLVEGAGSNKEIQNRIEQIRNEIDVTTSDYDREKLQERLAKLAGGVALIRVGGATETEVKEKKARVEDALSATRAAVEEGILPGGGIALLRSVQALKNLKGKSLEEEAGINIIRKALEAPIRMIATNAGQDGGLVVKKALADKSSTFGYDAHGNRFGDLIQWGIMDPAKVTRTALQNAVSVSNLLLTSEALVTDIPSKDKGQAGHAHGGGGMPGMGGGMPGMGGMGGMPGMGGMGDMF